MCSSDLQAPGVDPAGQQRELNFGCRNSPEAARAQPVGWVERPSFARSASYGGFESAVARSAKAEVKAIVLLRRHFRKMMGFAEPVIGPATSGRTSWLNSPYALLALFWRVALFS